MKFKIIYFVTVFLLSPCIRSNPVNEEVTETEATTESVESYTTQIPQVLDVEEQAKIYLEELDTRYSKECNLQTTKRWDYITNVTDHNEEVSIKGLNEFNKFQAAIQSEIISRFPNWKSFKNPDIRREFQFLSIQGPGTMPPERVDEMNAITSNMEASYAKARVCDYKNRTKCDLRLEPEITEKLHTVRDYDELAYYWVAWHDSITKAVTPQNYTRFVEFQNEESRANNFKDTSDEWATYYDTGDVGWTAQVFKTEMKKLWGDLKPKYSILHAYVRMKLRAVSKKHERKIKRFGYIPAHLLGNMWAQDWSSIESLTKPYPDAPSLDATKAMKSKGYNPVRLFEEADKFFTDMGLLKMTKTFWEKSMLERPNDREVVCHASAEDFCWGRGSTDFRIKQCTVVNMDHLITAHHEMGHIEYFMQYTNLSYMFRNGANHGFHEAIGDALALAVATPKHLKCVLSLEMGLDDIDCEKKKNLESDLRVTETDINFLFRMALEKFAFFPFAISMDSWRWEVFEGLLREEDYSKRWWEIRREFQGIVPPEWRDPTKFDPAAKYHIVANVEYIRYFISHILQFQFYEAMCIAAGEFTPNDPNSKPLFKCDFSGCKEAGKKLGDMMKLGFSKPWPIALEIITGSPKMSMEPLMRYFEPLFKKLEKDVHKAGEIPCFGSDCEIYAAEFMDNFEAKEALLSHETSVATFDHYTDTEDVEKEEFSKKLSLENSLFIKEAWLKNTSQFEYKYFKDPLLKRKFKLNNNVGTSALPEEDIDRFNDLTTEMSKIYAQAKICPYSNQSCNLETEGLSLNPQIEEILTKHENYDEMAYAWDSWRDATGRKIRGLYYEYVDLANVAAKANGKKNMGDSWIEGYEQDTFRNDIEELWMSLNPLYQELHGYVRFKLSEKFSQINVVDPIPAHVLGNMWSQTWDNILKTVVPYPAASNFDVTDALKKKYTHDHQGVYEMFEVANSFFTSMGLEDMRVAYGEKSLIIKPQDRIPICHASAWDLSDGKDFRIKMCTNINQEDFITIHHELGHIQYYMQYKNQPLTFRGGANPGFHEAIGDVISLSVSTPKHMQKLGLIENMIPTEESRINYLMKKALEKIAFLPFGFLIDSYRWKIFDGSIPRENYTYNWMQMRTKYQGIIPPSVRNEDDFDAGSKYHVPADVPYIRYFVSAILQFQVHKALCIEAGEYPANPLDKCDIYESKKAGEKFMKILKSGQEKKWQETLNAAIGESKLSADAIKEYFTPLFKFIREQRQIHNYPIGWDENAFENFYSRNGEK